MGTPHSCGIHSHRHIQIHIQGKGERGDEAGRHAQTKHGHGVRGPKGANFCCLCLQIQKGTAVNSLVTKHIHPYHLGHNISHKSQLTPPPNDRREPKTDTCPQASQGVPGQGTSHSADIQLTTWMEKGSVTKMSHESSSRDEPRPHISARRGTETCH